MATDAPPKANALAIGIKWYNVLIATGLKPDSQQFSASLIAHIANEIASIEGKRPNDVGILGRARVAASYLIAMRAGNDYPGGVTGVIGNFVGSLPFVPSPVDQEGNPIPKPLASDVIEGVVKAPLTVAEFLAKLTDVHVWIRVAEVAGGAVLIVIGVRMLARESGVPLPKVPIPGR